MKSSRSLTLLLAALVPVAVLGGCKGCNKDDDDAKPAASASAPPPASTPPPVATVVPEEDAGTPDAGVDAGPPPAAGGGGWGSGNLSKCCAALMQNANSAPLDQKGYYLAAANACNGMRNTPAGQQAFANIRSFLAGAKMPAACK